VTHPCVPNHACDHCYLCDVVGVCCMTVRDAATATTADPDEILRQAILAESHSAVNLADLIRVEAVSGGRPAPRPPLLLPAPQPAPSLPIDDQVKEVVPRG
jgi:hypothetical protein